MRTIRMNVLVSLFGVATLAMLGSGCTVTIQPAMDPTTAPPAPPATTLTCGPNAYVHGGRYQWRHGKWVWVAPRCVARPATWRAGCRWTRGHWVRSGRRYVFRAGRLVCPTAPAGPSALPPPPPAVAVTCAAGQYLRGGKYVWRAGKWVWINPRCIARPAIWHAGCRWVRGHWARRGNRPVFRAGHLSCPKVATPPPPPPVVHPTMLPPMRPPRTYRRVRCRRGTVRYPGRYVWNGRTRQYTWRPGVCVKRAPRYRRCRFVAGTWRYYGRRAWYIRPHWVCRGKTHYVTRTGAVWTPPPTYKPFLRWRRCRAGYVNDAKGRCIRYRAKCRRGYVRRGVRCVRAPLKCRPGFAKRANRCVKIKRAVRCRPGFAKRANRCVKIKRPVRCRPGFIKRGNRCLRVKRAPMRGKPVRCRPGFVKRGHRCVKAKRAPRRGRHR